MKKTLIPSLPMWLPEEIRAIGHGSDIYDSSSSPEARVYFIDRDGGYYLKVGAANSLRREAEMTAYFYKKGLGAEVISYISGEKDIMLSRAMAGLDCTSEKYLAEPKRLCDITAERLRMLHELDASDCPVRDRVGEYIAMGELNYAKGTYNTDHFPDSFGYRSGEEAYRVLQEGKHLLKNEVLIHGDYCLPNIMLDAWRFSGFIDVGNGGVGDRHVDLYWGAWTLRYNLGTDVYRNRFFDAYGRDLVDQERLRLISVMEVFG
jgi:kanamycin kinase